MANELERRIKEVCDSTQPRTRARRDALAAIRWVLRDQHGNYAALDSNACMTAVEDRADAIVFDGRDNEELKRGYYERITGLNYTVELL